jgi:hypothetical protein
MCALLWFGSANAAALGDDFACVKRERTLQEVALAVEWQPDESADFICFDLLEYADILNKETGITKTPQQWGTFIRSNQVRQNACRGAIEPYYHKSGSLSTFKRACNPGEQVLEFTLDDPASPNARWRPFIAMECLNPLVVPQLPQERALCQSERIVEVVPHVAYSCTTAPGLPPCAQSTRHFARTTRCNQNGG